MIKRIIGMGPVAAGFFPFDLDFDYDKIKQTSKTAQAFYKRNAENETGWDRLYLMFSLDEFNKTSPELNATVQSGFMGLFIGACYGGIIRSKVAYINFMERNEATAFKSHIDAKKKLQDAVTMSFAKGAYQWGWRLGLFTMSYVGFTTAISVYRGKTGIVEYIAAGTITGSLYKWTLGPRAMLVGGLLGTALGTVAGLVSYGVTKMTGMSLEEARYWQYQWKTDREKRILKIFKTHQESSEDVLVKNHNKTIGEIDPKQSLDQISTVGKTDS